MKKKDLTSHRIIEKRRRDRMNNCLADLSKLIPDIYLKKRSGRVEKTEIIEMAIKYLKDLIEKSKANVLEQNQTSEREGSDQHPLTRRGSSGKNPLHQNYSKQAGLEQHQNSITTTFQDDKSPSPSTSSTSSSLASTSATIGSSVNNDDFQLYSDCQEVSLLSLSSPQQQQQQQQQQHHHSDSTTNGVNFINSHNNHHLHHNQHLLHHHHVASSSSLSSQSTHLHTDHHLHHHQNRHHQNLSQTCTSKASLQQRQSPPNSKGSSDSRGSNRSISSGSLSTGSTSSSSLSNGLVSGGDSSGSSGYCCCDAKILSTSHSTGNLSNVGDIDSNVVINRTRFNNGITASGLNLRGTNDADHSGVNNCSQLNANHSSRVSNTNNSAANDASNSNYDNGNKGRIAFSNNNTVECQAQNQDAGNENDSVVPPKYSSITSDCGVTSGGSNINNNGAGSNSITGYPTSNSDFQSNLSSAQTRSTSSLAGWSKKAWLVRSFSRSSTSQR